MLLCVLVERALVTLHVAMDSYNIFPELVIARFECTSSLIVQLINGRRYMNEWDFLPRRSANGIGYVFLVINFLVIYL